MTLQAIGLLRLLCKQKPTEETTFEILPRCDYLEVDLDPEKHVNFSKYADNIIGIIKYLDKLGYVEIDDGDPTVFHLTHPGLHYFQSATCAVFWSIVKAIALPIFLSIATTLITMYVQSLL